MKNYANEAGVLLGRVEGAQARHEIERLVAPDVITPGHPVALDFDGVVAVTVPFADECIGQLLSGRLAGYYEDHPILAIKTTEDVRETLALVLRQRRLLLLGVSDGDAELLGGDEVLESTLHAAQQHERFSATELAQQLGVSPQAMNNRLKTLLRSGALRRTRILPARGGKEFEYELPPWEERKPGAGKKHRQPGQRMGTTGGRPRRAPR